MVVGCQPYAPAAFTPMNIPGTHFHYGLSRPHMSLKNPVTPPGIDPGTVRLVAQRLNHYATPGPQPSYAQFINRSSASFETSETFLLRTRYNITEDEQSRLSACLILPRS